MYQLCLLEIIQMERYINLNHIDDACYIGATTQTLSKRMGWHRDAILNNKVNHRPLYKHMVEHGVEEFYIEILENREMQMTK